jgi:PAS domain S-box-containing protein
MEQMSTYSASRRDHHAGGNHALIEFTTDGIILTANEAFLKATGYTLDEIVGKHHSIFHDHRPGGQRDHRKFWAALARGDSRHGAFKLIGKDGQAVWLRANFIPVHDSAGRSLKVVKYMTLSGTGTCHAPRGGIGFKHDHSANAANDRFIQAMRAGLQGS